MEYLRKIEHLSVLTDKNIGKFDHKFGLLMREFVKRKLYRISSENKEYMKQIVMESGM